jgi:hypothetical protein
MLLHAANGAIWLAGCKRAKPENLPVQQVTNANPPVGLRHIVRQSLSRWAALASLS